MLGFFVDTLCDADPHRIASAERTMSAEEGVQFPSDSTGKRSTLAGGKLIFAAAAGAADASLAEAISGEKNWRQEYTKHLTRLMEVSAASPENALKMADAGLDALYTNFEFVRDGANVRLPEAMAKPSAQRALSTGKVIGAMPPALTLEVPYEGKQLSGPALSAQIQAWADYGCMEPDCAAALSSLVGGGKALDLRGKVFVVLGATSALGPLKSLLLWGATVVGVARRKRENWSSLIEFARASSGTLIFPLYKPTDATASDEVLAAAAGADLMVDTPEIGAWLKGVLATLKAPAVMGMYTYLDSDQHVRVSLACDAVMREAVDSKSASGLAYIQTPSIAVDVPPAVHAAAQAAYNASWLSMLGYAPNARPAVKSATTGAPDRFVEDLFLSLQGPNYALAKSMQMWRQLLARCRDGVLVSTNVAPAARTASVVSGDNKNAGTVAVALEGTGYFKPLAVFDGETVSVCMAALLVYDVLNPASLANPRVSLAHPHDLLSANAFHGGYYRCGIKPAALAKLQFLSGKLLGRAKAPLSHL